MVEGPLQNRGDLASLGDPQDLVEESGRGLRLPVKLAVLSHIVPPAPFSGHAVMLYRLLKDVAPDDYCLVSDRRRESGAPSGGRDSTPGLATRYHYLRSDSKVLAHASSDDSEGGAGKATPVAGSEGGSKPSLLRTIGSRLPGWLKSWVARGVLKRVGRVRWFVGQLLAGPRRVRGMLRVIRQEGCGAVLAISGDPFDLPAGYLAARLARVPFYAYIFDDYLYQWNPYPLYSFIARRVEPTVIRGAAGVMVLNEFVQDEYRRRYPGVEPTVVRNAFEVPEIEQDVSSARSWGGSEARILYTGNVYHAHYDAFRNLLSALRRLDPPDAKLHLHTGQHSEGLDGEGIGGPALVRHGTLPSSEVFDVLRRADILFLPLAFDSTIPEVIKTSCPMKTGEYLASGRPILVHAPPDSFLCWYFRKHECGVVVDQRDPEQLARAIRSILDDASLRERIGRNARARAEADFDLATAQEDFVKVLRSGEKG